MVYWCIYASLGLNELITSKMSSLKLMRHKNQVSGNIHIVMQLSNKVCLPKVGGSVSVTSWWVWPLTMSWSEKGLKNIIMVFKIFVTSVGTKVRYKMSFRILCCWPIFTRQTHDVNYEKCMIPWHSQCIIYLSLLHTYSYTFDKHNFAISWPLI